MFSSLVRAGKTGWRHRKAALLTASVVGYGYHKWKNNVKILKGETTFREATEDNVLKAGETAVKAVPYGSVGVHGFKAYRIAGEEDKVGEAERQYPVTKGKFEKGYRWLKKGSEADGRAKSDPEIRQEINDVVNEAQQRGHKHVKTLRQAVEVEIMESGKTAQYGQNAPGAEPPRGLDPT